jgi:N,N-dimethylformamidase
LRSADERVAVALPSEEVVTSVPPIDFRSRPQSTHVGSFGVVENLEPLLRADVVSFSAWLYPTKLEHPTAQCVLCVGELALFLAPDGCLELWLGPSLVCRGDEALVRREWSRVDGRFSSRDGGGALAYRPRKPLPGGLGRADSNGRVEAVPDPPTVPPRLVLAAGLRVDELGRLYGEHCFNGKLEAVEISAEPFGCLLRLDLSRDLDGDRIVDVSGNERHGRLFNLPTRAVTGRCWERNETDFRHAPAQWAAAHFHDDDLEDANWPVATTLKLPEDIRSGIYAVRLRADDLEDRIPFFVLPPGHLDGRPAIAFLAPTFTYQAYANARLRERIDYEGGGLTEREFQPGPRDAQVDRNRELSGSLYDVHSDGSGCCYSTLRRPIFNFRADYKSALQQAPRHLGADIYLTSWLEHNGHDFDVLTDHALDEHGAPLLAPYRVLVTGTHPEYVSSAMLDALETFVDQGGRVMYLGGNGFYWVTSRDAKRPHIIECRRGHAGTRTWDSAPGETHHGTTGEPGGLWRHRGRAPNILFGVGMASQGWDRKAPGYRRTHASLDARVAWIFDGLPSEGVIGDAGLVMDGASGDELDRYDEELGSPAHAVVVATSLPHSRYYKLVIEDVPMLTDGLGGDENPNVRSDVVYAEHGNRGGAVFAVGSIGWAGAMAYANFDNDVSTLTRNVLDRFLTHTRSPAPNPSLSSRP